MTSPPSYSTRQDAVGGGQKEPFRFKLPDSRDHHAVGMNSSRRLGSPAAAAAASYNKYRHGGNSNSPGKPRGRSLERSQRPQPGPPPQRPRDRYRDPSRDNNHLHRAPPPPQHPPSHHKRPRSRSPSPTSLSRPMRSRHSPPRSENPLEKNPSLQRGSRRPSPRSRRSRSPSPSRRGPRLPPKDRPRFSRSPDRDRRPKPRSPRREFDQPLDRRDGRPDGRDDRPDRQEPRTGRREPSPRQASRGRSRPVARDARPSPSPNPSTRRRGSFDSRPETPFPPRSPQERRRSKKKKSRGKPRPPRDFDPASGANSVEVNMSARGGFRGGFNPQHGYGHRPYSQSPGHGTPTSSFHGSPPVGSPYGSNRGWGGQPHYSPQSQFPPLHSAANFAPPTGPSAHFHANSPPYPPTGPAAQFSPANYRGGPRGGFRGGAFGGGRGGHRGGFKNSQWNSQRNNMEEASHPSNHSSPKHPETSHQAKEDDVGEDGDNPFRPPKDLQVEDTSKAEQTVKDHMPPPNRLPPTGPQSHTPNKFSFTMKATSKPAVSGPRPEISSKFNAVAKAATASAPTPAPAPASAPAPAPRGLPPKPEVSRSGLPKNVPTEPASARARHEHRPPESNSSISAPRTRKVTKVMKRPKPRPKLPPDLAKSKSVFFRKSGNASVVGSGTYGKVFKGLNVYTRKSVALKKIRMEGERDGFPVTAVREVKLLRSLKHVNVVELQEVLVENNECYMVFEYLSHDLTGLINHPTYQMDHGVKKHFAKQLFEGLDYLHARGVLHRDIKAANILVSSEGVLKLADFGLARFYSKSHQLDYTNRVITIWYRPPELLLGETQYGPAVDIWSAACVMYEIFNKTPLFAGDGSEINQLEKVYEVLGTPNKTEWPNLIEMPWFELLRPGYRKPRMFVETQKNRVSASALELLGRMLQYDPAKRPTAAEVLQHAYFTTEDPPPRQASELRDLKGDWHEIESKALRKKEREEREREKKAAAREAAREAAQKEAEKDGAVKDSTAAARSASDGAQGQERDRKRPNESAEGHRDAKRLHVESKPPNRDRDRDRIREKGKERDRDHGPVPSEGTSAPPVVEVAASKA